MNTRQIADIVWRSLDSQCELADAWRFWRVFPDEPSGSAALARLFDDPLQATEPLCIETPAPAFERAVAEVAQLANAGDAEAAYWMGEFDSKGVSMGIESLALAVQWWSKAFALGYGPAGRRWSVAQLYGKEVPQDPEAALARLGQLVEQGDAEAARELGRFHLRKPLPQRQVDEGMAWLARADALGDETALVEMQNFHIAQTPKGQWPKAAVDTLTQAAERGNASAAYVLGRYLIDHGAPRVAGELGITMLTRAFDSKLSAHVRAQAAYALAMAYLDQEFPAHNDTEVLRWLNLSAASGGARACRFLAQVYGRGALGALSNPGEAFRWALRSARLGLTDGALLVGQHMLRGLGIEKDSAQGARWIRHAAVAGVAEAQTELAFLYWSNDAGLARDESEVYKWARIAALQKNPKGMYLLGECHMRGIGTPADEQAGLQWLTRSAKSGEAFAQARLAKMYFHGIVVEADFAEAAKWASLGADQGDTDAQCILGEMFVFGHGVEVDYAAAAEWLRSAAEQENPRAQGLYGLLCALGAGIPRNWIEALAWLKPAARAGDERARDFLKRYGLEWAETTDAESGDRADQPTPLHPPKFPLRLFHGKWLCEGTLIEFLDDGTWRSQFQSDGVEYRLAGTWRVHGERLLMRLEASDQPVDDAYIEQVNRPSNVLHIDERELLMEDARDLSTIRYDRVIDEPAKRDATVLPFPGHDRTQPEPHA